MSMFPSDRQMTNTVDVFAGVAGVAGARPR
jgi:hypothetical protein